MKKIDTDSEAVNLSSVQGREIPDFENCGYGVFIAEIVNCIIHQLYPTMAKTYTLKYYTPFQWLFNNVTLESQAESSPTRLWLE